MLGTNADDSSRYLEGRTPAVVPQSPTAKHDGEELKLCHRWIREMWSAEADMKVGLFHGQAAETAEALNGNTSPLM